MGHLIIKANEWKYKQYDRQSKEQFCNGITDEMMTTGIIKELTTMQKTSDNYK